MPADDVVSWFGRNALPLFAVHYPQLFEPHDSTRSFVLTLNDIIHPEVRKLYPGADVPEFDFAFREELLVMGYRSPRKMCSFAEGLLLGAADHFGERADDRATCLHEARRRPVRARDHGFIPVAADPVSGARLEALEKRLKRERLARREVEAIAERSTRALYDKQQELVLLEAVVSTSNESATVEDALRGAADAVCVHTGWPVGHVYLVDPASGYLASTTSWHVELPDQFAEFRRLTEQMSFPPGVGLPGRVFATGEAAWITDVARDPSFTRKDLGVRGAFAFPIHADGGVIAVLEFFTGAAIAPDPALLDVMAQIGRQLGRVVERIQAQEQLAHQATHDALTGLANRLLFRDRLELVLARAARRRLVRRAAVPRPRPVQGRERHARPQRRRPAPARRLGPAARGPARERHGRPLRRRGVHAGALRRRRVRRALRGPRLGGRRGAGGGAHPAGAAQPVRPRALRARR